MHETENDIQGLARLINRSNDNAGAFLRSSFEIPHKTLSANQLCRKLGPVTTVVLSTVTSDGKPRVAPVVAIFYRAAFYIPTVANSLRARHIRNNPEVSLSLYEGNDFAVIIHGRAAMIDQYDDLFATLVEMQIASAAGDVREWGEPVFIRVDAERLYSFARYPEKFPGKQLVEDSSLR